jgi:hypothetical protein
VQLSQILDGDFGGGDDIHKLYQQILEVSFNNADNHTIGILNDVLAVIVLSKIPFHYDDLQYFVTASKLSITSILDKLSSVITVRETDRRIQINHLSFAEFICAPDRCPERLS